MGQIFRVTGRALLVAAAVAVLALAPLRANAANLDEACGGPSAAKCNSALWCQHESGQCKAEAPAGKCERIVTFCMRVTRPVCGCNGKTYANDCERQRSKVQLDHTGACKKT